MVPDIRWIEAIYRGPQDKGQIPTHIAVPDNARTALLDMA